MLVLRIKTSVASVWCPMNVPRAEPTAVYKHVSVAVPGRMVLAQRGNCSFANKARMAQRAKAIGLVVYGMFFRVFC